MIISRAPVRISLGGGGTDLASYYSKYEGFLIAGAIDKYVFIALNKRFYDSIRLSYSSTEIVDHVNDIKHNIFRECLKSVNIQKGVELVSIADVPANCGLGSSSTFTVAVLNALHDYKREFISLKELAEEACHIEIDRLSEPIGKQDQYISTFGGVTAFTFGKDGNVIVEPVHMTEDSIDELERNILLFYTGIERSASEILSDQNEKSKKDEGDVIGTLHKIKEIGRKTKTAFERGDLDKFGELLDEHWQIKKNLSQKISNPFIDECYNTAMKNGALGGKIMGAGGGGFFMFYCSGDQMKLKSALKEKGLQQMRFHFDFEGAKILVNMKANMFENNIGIS
jgi:D-glycero-alpha-D-manno-heptose-7-phosphate kinase